MNRSERQHREDSRLINRWGVILAGGDGTRLRSLTRTITGDERPKQFCPLIGGQTLLDQTRARISEAIPERQTLFVVTKSHETFYQPLAAAVQKQQLLVQPANKGTAPAILYALMKIACYAPNAVVAFFPSDHYFSDNQMFMAHVETAFEVAEKTPGTITLLGITPDSPEVEYGWIEPRVTRFDLPRVIARVRRFWEKPSPTVAQKLMERGCLWNSFVMVGRVEDFLGMVRRALPELYSFFRAITPSFDTEAEAAGLRELYSSIADTNFSHQVLALRPDDLTVLKVERVGWSDLGDPSRVLSTLGRIGAQAELALSAS